ncbi:DUF6266 family protein [Flavobacterium sangjuense]|uniref:Uncharacterized protein n=1 Tax=Flavobacterium sangjuense TaxID=2518177 RepID=A0A4P7PW51_9FLAO|nr:DUF6266 family protein [Flavobacterium sangjuense]QBZ98532.1 hypothetical protein GS03_02040 [Flavobacterium sangjuense]
MGTYNKGILGPFSGKVGTVVGANWRGKDVMRSLPKKTDRTPTETQLLQREKFTAVSNFLTPISNVLSLYYGSGSGELTRRNQAMSYHMKDAVTYVDPNFEILFDKVQISKGDLLGVQNPAASSSSPGEIKFTWENNSEQGSAKATDQLVVVLYSPMEDIYYTNGNAATRDAGTVTLTLPAYFSGLEVQVWITFASATGKSYATSVYLGAVTVS